MNKLYQRKLLLHSLVGVCTYVLYVLYFISIILYGKLLKRTCPFQLSSVKRTSESSPLQTYNSSRSSVLIWHAMDFCFDVKGNSPRVSNHNVIVGGGGGYTSTFMSKIWSKNLWFVWKNMIVKKNYQTHNDEMSQSSSTLDLSQNNNNHCI